MTDGDLPEFAGQMAILSEVYDRDVSEALGAIYFETLRPFPLDDIRWAVAYAVRTSKYFPRPAELIEMIQSRRRALAERRAAETRALAAGPPSDEDCQLAKTFIAQIRELVGRAAVAMTTRRRPEPVAPPSAAELDAHERRKREVLDQAIAAGALTAEDLERVRKAGH